jgi:uncharacterized protein (TIGR03083 family)
MSELGFERLAYGLREQTECFARALAGADPEAMVPTCPEWRVRRLAGHIGQEYRWAARIVGKGEYVPFPDVSEADPGEQWTPWLLAGAEELIDAVRERGPQGEVWTFLGPRPALFWLRRMLNEICVHHADAAFASGAVYEVAEDLAADMIGEGLGLLSAPGADQFKPELAELRGRGERIVLRPPSTTGWVITRTPDGVRWERGDDDGDVTVTGPVASLLLLFSRRLPPEDPQVNISGDPTLLNHWLTHTKF